MSAPSSPDHLLEIAAVLVERALPGEELEVVCASSESTTIRVYEGEVESLTQAESHGIGVRVIVGGRQGFASAGTFDPNVVEQMLAEARDNARFAESDPHAGVAQPDGVTGIDLDLWRDELFSWTLEQKIALAADVERRVRSADPRITGVRTSTYSDSASVSALASSSGIRAASRGTSASVSVQALAADGGQIQTGYAGDGARHPGLLDLDGVVQRASSQALGLLGATQPTTRRVSLILDQRQAATMLSVIAGTLNGGRVIKGRTPFADRVSETIATPLLTILDDPIDPDSLGAESHDGEGLATRQVALITDGVLQGFVWDSYNGRRSGTGSTGSAQRGARGLPSPGIHALSVKAGSGGSLEQLISGVDDGVLVFGFAGLHSGVNAVSGDLSLGVEGRMVRNGQLAEPINEATVGSTLQRLLLDIVAVGSDRTHLPSGVSTPSLVIGDVMLSGTSA
ncbi:MAG: TldD/PmbA family protein [Actinomycetota bacterium]|nr:TldD/PmbA family protein [Actinomycetota bacterium]